MRVMTKLTLISSALLSLSLNPSLYGKQIETVKIDGQALIDLFNRDSIIPLDKAEKHLLNDIKGEEDLGNLAAVLELMNKKSGSKRHYLMNKDMKEDFFIKAMPEKASGGIGLQLQARGVQSCVVDVLAGSAAESAGLQKGDCITHVDQDLVFGKDLKEVVAKIRGPQGATVTLTVKRGSDEFNFAIIRKAIKIPSIQAHTFSEGQLTVKLAEFVGEGLLEEFEALESSYEFDKIVLDLSQSRGGDMRSFNALARLLLKKGMLIERSVKKENGQTKEDTVFAQEDGRLSGLEITAIGSPRTDGGAAFLLENLKFNGIAKDITIHPFDRYVSGYYELENGMGFFLIHSMRVNSLPTFKAKFSINKEALQLTQQMAGRFLKQPQSLQICLLKGLELNLSVLEVFQQNQRDQEYVFGSDDKSESRARMYLQNNLDHTLSCLSGADWPAAQ